MDGCTNAPGDLVTLAEYPGVTEFDGVAIACSRCGVVLITEDEQRRLLEAVPRKLRAFVLLALITGARAGELLSLRWEHVSDGFLTFWETKNGKPRRLPLSGAIEVVLAALPRVHSWVFTSALTEQPYTVNGLRHVFNRAVERAGTHAEAHHAESDDREGVRRLHRHGDQWPLIDADAGPPHAPNRGPEDGCVGLVHARRGHKAATTALGRSEHR